LGKGKITKYLRMKVEEKLKAWSFDFGERSAIFKKFSEEKACKKRVFERNAKNL
jgi:hypothetical protein